MKFDKVMDIAYKILAILTCAALVLGIVSCSKSYAIKASAIEISASEQAGIQDYFDAYSNGLAGISIDFSTDEDGNRTRKLEILGLQQLAFREQFKVYDNLDFTLAPDTLSMAGSCSSALYQVSGDPNYYVVNLFPVSGGKYPWIAATSQHFNLSISLSNYLAQGDFPSVTRYVQYGVNGSTSTGFYFSGSGQNRHIYMTDKSGFFSDWELQTQGCQFYISSTSIPVFTVGQRLQFGGTIGGFGSTYNLPESDVPTVSPWDYYNDTLLPYIRQNYNIENIDQYFVFPNGYTPSQDPTEPPSITPGTPGGGVTVIAPVIIGVGGIFNIDGVDFDIFAPVKGQLSIDGIDFQFPRDDSSKVYINQTPYTIPLPEIEINGHSISLPDINTIIFDGAEFTINSDGSLTINEQNYPLPIGEPETIESNAQYYIYKYEIPTLENINIPDAELEAPDLSQFANSLSFISSAAVDFVNELGLMPFIIAMLSLGVLGYALWKIGG